MATTTARPAAFSDHPPRPPLEGSVPTHTTNAYAPYGYAPAVGVHPHPTTIPPTGIPAPLPAAAPYANELATDPTPPKSGRLRRFTIWTATLLVMAAAIAGVWTTRPDGGPRVVTNETQAVAEPAPTLAPTSAPATTTPPTSAKPPAPAKPTTTVPKKPTTTTKPAPPTAKR